ncbi:DUF3139 domain-containing protein [Paenibacillus sp. NPDC058367]|uniref:DUF3139 domain-containing protein n=1 Tax=Paenibacillus sp. NPDC058367 TaxID=3346460 RepID=UPI003662991D
MKKRTKIILTTFAIVYGVASLALQAFRNHMDNEVIHYLVATRDYKNEDLYKVYTQIGKAPVVSTTVIFADEPNVRYFYRKEKDRIYQYNMSPVKVTDPNYTYKHIEEPLP